MVVVPGTEGESGIMAGHAPYSVDDPAQERRSCRLPLGEVASPRQIPVTRRLRRSQRGAD